MNSKLSKNDPRTALLRMLTGYQAINADDERHARDIERFVRSTPAGFGRSHTLGHITGAAWLVDAEGRRVLLTHHRKLNKWLQLGGHADGEADVRAVALREAEEESGLFGIVSVWPDP